VVAEAECTGLRFANVRARRAVGSGRIFDASDMAPSSGRIWPQHLRRVGSGGIPTHDWNANAAGDWKAKLAIFFRERPRRVGSGRKSDASDLGGDSIGRMWANNIRCVEFCRISDASDLAAYPTHDWNAHAGLHERYEVFPRTPPHV